MKITNERHIITNKAKNEAEQYGHFMHLASYNFAVKYVKNKRVLDYGCGTGYGTFKLAEQAISVIGIDISIEAINYAKLNYSSNNLNFITSSNFEKKNFKEEFDVVTSFQVIEHVKNEENYLKTIYNLLKPGGIFLLTTPNKKNRLFPFIQKPWNIYHIKEYNETGLKRILQKHYQKVEILNISAKSNFVKHEIKRLKKQKIITLPCTLFFYPRSLTVFLLKKQALLFNQLIYFKKYFKNKNPKTSLNNHDNLNYNLDAILIDDNLPNTTDLLGICKKL